MAQQTQQYITPLCPSCGSDIKAARATSWQVYEYNPDTGRYSVKDGNIDLTCDCGQDLNSEDIFADGIDEFQAEKWPTFEPNYDADVPKTVRKSDVECWPCKHCDTLGGNHERVPTKRGTKAGRCNPDDLASYRTRQKPEV